MALDIAALRNKLDSFKDKGQQSSAFWKPSKGKQVIRIVPWNKRPENPFFEQYFHYGLTERGILSPITNGEADPIVEFAEKIRAENTRESYQQSRAFMPKLRTTVPVIVRGEEEMGVRWYSFGATVYKALLNYIDDDDYGDITHPDTGRDITLEYIPQAESDTNFAQTNILVKPKETPLSDDAKQQKHWLEVQPDIQAINKAPSYDEMTLILKRYLDPEGDHGTEGQSVTESLKTPTPEPKQSTSVPSESSGDSIAQFEELFGA